MRLFAPDDPRPIHFLGVGGAGMSALALLARRRGVAVTGCDTDPAGAADVAAAGAEIQRGHDPAHVSGVRAVVFTAAVPADHPEIRAARAAGVPVVRRADALQSAIGQGRVVGIAGTHGKTTTTVMATEALAAVGFEPTGLAGGRVAAWRGNLRPGRDDVYVVEADEYDQAFLALRPEIAVVNNVEADHLECYGSLDALEAAFATFAQHGRRVLVGADDPGARRVAARISGPIWRVGQGHDADICIRAVVLEPGGTRAELLLPGGAAVRLRLTVPGLHNVRNAAMAIGVAAALDADVATAARALASFDGVGRRFELVGEADGVVVVDDYAHHPSEVAATLEAARQRYPTRRVVAVFQPHLYSRTQVHGAALGAALAGADLAVVTEIYRAREQPIPGVSGRQVAEAAQRAGVETVWAAERATLAARVRELAREGDLVLTMGAGDVTGVGRELLTEIRGHAA